MPGRAVTESQKLEVLDLLYKIWMCNKELRFGQMLLNAVEPDFYHMEDFDLVRALQDFYSRH